MVHTLLRHLKCFNANIVVWNELRCQVQSSCICYHPPNAGNDTSCQSLQCEDRVGDFSKAVVSREPLQTGFSQLSEQWLGSRENDVEVKQKPKLRLTQLERPTEGEDTASVTKV